MSQRAYKPTALKVLEGNRGKRPIPENEPKPRPILPQCPKFLDSQAKKTWKTLAPQLFRLGLLAEGDTDRLADLCILRSILLTIYRVMKKSKNKALLQTDTQIGADGKPHVINMHESALSSMIRKYQGEFRKAANDFGLSPRGRVGLSVGHNDPDEGEDLLTR